MKNNRFLMLFFILSILVFMANCVINIDDSYNKNGKKEGNGKIVSEERITVEFVSVVLNGSGDINIYPGKKYDGECYAVIVTTDSNIQDDVEVKEKNKCLYIETKNNYSFNPTKLIIDVYLPELNEVELVGVGDIRINGGNADKIDITLSGVGNINASQFQAKDVNVNLSGVGNIKTWATRKLAGKLSGVGDVSYKGNPDVNINVSGIGSVDRL